MKNMDLEDGACAIDSYRRGGQNETDEAMVFSTADTSVQGTGRGQVNNLVMGSQSSMGVLEESKSSRQGNLLRHNEMGPRYLPQECAPPELGRPSLSEKNEAKSKQFSPQFDRMSSHTKGMGNDEDLLDDTEPSCDAFMESEHCMSRRPPKALDGVFMVGKDVKSLPAKDHDNDD